MRGKYREDPFQGKVQIGYLLLPLLEDLFYLTDLPIYLKQLF